jgi:hypothetical protein
MIRAVAMTKRQIKRALDILKSQDDGSYDHAEEPG